MLTEGKLYIWTNRLIDLHRRPLQLRNLQKKAKMSRHEQEKEYMVRLRDLGHAVGEYVGGGQGDGREDEHHGSEPEPDVDTCLEGQNTEDSSENAHPLLLFYD